MRRQIPTRTVRLGIRDWGVGRVGQVGQGRGGFDIIEPLSFHVLFPFALMLSRITSGRIRKGAPFFK